MLPPHEGNRDCMGSVLVPTIRVESPSRGSLVKPKISAGNVGDCE
jgi:hypothetical protein